jgi:hypothetical protein
VGDAQLTMSGIDPIAYLQQAAGRLDRLETHAEIERMLDDVEYLLEVLDPELQELAYGVIDRLQARLGQLP